MDLAVHPGQRLPWAGTACFVVQFALSAMSPVFGTVLGAPLGLAALVLGALAARRGERTRGVPLAVPALLRLATT